ncbi:hypothetical protein BvCmsKKP059_04980 [Escherichia coli]|nr:hypothetical protein BvCmsKKP059_04980 [Escherichia coli]GDH79713.1 hypothetical protein BvCmsKKP062_01569 [Escherichia coli]GDI31986.1 hypothetical protein BvCmsKSNP013_02511 [Escherichia coli]GDJ26359.1 hypothetical protein BvCmsKSP036_01528 [Escherichia coli]GDJ83771.1 hypothetical protein BvCmsKSP037_03762 [Escherichia coli]
MELFAITDNTVGTRIVRIVTDRPTQNVVTQLFSEQKTFQKVWNFQVDTSLVEMSFLSFLTLMMLSLY